MRYRVERSEAEGFGGDMYNMSAWETSAGGHILYQQGDQAELGEPSFDLFWTIVEGARVRAR